jgi:4-hydroxy-tetrahydrodipicolinate synthase
VSAEDEFGVLITAMVTPFADDGELDLEGAQRLARWLTAPGRNDGLIVNGTTGEAATTTDGEKADLLRAVLDAVDGSVRVIAGVGTSDTRHSIELARQAEAAGAHALLLVTPYYCRPSQDGILRHFRAVADSTPLPVMLYDIPQRTGVAVEPATLVRAAEHDRIRAVKDSKGDLESTTWVMNRAPLAYYSAIDALNLPMLSIGAVGFTSVVGHVAAEQLLDMIFAYREGRVGEAERIHRRLLPISQGLFRAPAAALVKAALQEFGLPAGPVRSPLADATPEERAALRADLLAGGVDLALVAQAAA